MNVNACCCYQARNSDLYHKYLQQHASMTHWFQQFQHHISYVQPQHNPGQYNPTNNEDYHRNCSEAWETHGNVVALGETSNGNHRYQHAALGVTSNRNHHRYQHAALGETSNGNHHRYQHARISKRKPISDVDTDTSFSDERIYREYVGRPGSRSDLELNDRGFKSSSQQENHYKEDNSYYSSESDADDVSVSDSSTGEDQDSKESDFELVESVKEEFEYVQLDKFGNMPEDGVKGVPHLHKDLEDEKKTKLYLYGEKADTISGLETAISLDYNRLCDLYQPHLWPILPLRLGKK